MLGLEQHRKRDLTGAADSWQRGVAKDPNHAEMLEKLARTLAELDRFTVATVVIQQLMNQPGWDGRANLILGTIYDMMNAPSRRPWPSGAGWTRREDPSTRPSLAAAASCWLAASSA